MGKSKKPARLESLHTLSDPIGYYVRLYHGSWAIKKGVMGMSSIPSKKSKYFIFFLNF